MNCKECFFIYNCSFHGHRAAGLCPRQKAHEVIITDEFPERCVGILRFSPQKIIHNGPATIVFWTDGSKTVVKCAAGTEPDLYNAFCAALAKKVFGTNSKLKKAIKEAIPESKEIHYKVGDCVILIDGSTAPCFFGGWVPGMKYDVGKIGRIIRINEDKTQAEVDCTSWSWDIRYLRRVNNES